MKIANDDLRASIAAQCDALCDLADRANALVAYMKPHGALYHAANDDLSLADALVAGAIEALGYEIVVLGPPAGALAEACARAGVALLGEGFADRATRADGSLVPRGESGALIVDPQRAAARALELARSQCYRTICVHGDTPGAESIARAVRMALASEFP